MEKSALDVDTHPELLFVRIGGAPFALPVSAVSEVLLLVEPTPVPGWPERCLGLFDLRGDLLPLVDVNEPLARPPSRLSASHHIVVVVTAEKRWGLVVEAVDGVRAAPVQDRQGLESAGALASRGLCRGIATDGGTPVVVVDVDALLRDLHLDRSAAP